MSAIGPGSLLLCVDAGAIWADRLVNNATYEVFALIDCSMWACRRCGETHQHGVDLGIGTKLDLPTGLPGYPAICRFIPAGRKGDFESLLTPADAPVEHEVVA